MDESEFSKLIASVKEMGKIVRGSKEQSRTFEYSPLDVKTIRETIGLSQKQFSNLIRVSMRTLQNWEQGRRHPQGPALALLTILKNDPIHALQALN